MHADLLSIAALTALVMISPGPDLALVARNTVWGGRASGAWTSAGILTGNLVHIAYCSAGIGWLIANSVVAFTTLKFAGGAYLVFLGVQSLRSSGSTEDAPELPRVGHRASWVQGLLNNLLNPKGALFYLGVFAVFVGPESTALDLFLIVATMMTISAAFWVLFVAVLQIQSVDRALRGTARWVDRVLGAVLVGLGIRLWLEETPR